MLSEAGFRPEIIDRQLSHKERSHVRAIYNRAVYLEERRVMMQAWADMVERLHDHACDMAPVNPRPAAFRNNSSVAAPLADHEVCRPLEIVPAI